LFPHRREPGREISGNFTTMFIAMFTPMFTPARSEALRPPSMVAVRVDESSRWSTPGVEN
jgi:hypothetical protein